MKARLDGNVSCVILMAGADAKLANQISYSQSAEPAIVYITFL